MYEFYELYNTDFYGYLHFHSIRATISREHRISNVGDFPFVYSFVSAIFGFIYPPLVKTLTIFACRD
jgi:hypothetical protein